VSEQQEAGFTRGPFIGVHDPAFDYMVPRGHHGDVSQHDDHGHGRIGRNRIPTEAIAL